MISSLIYVSIRTSQCTDTEIEKILESSKKNNPDWNITGVLLYTSNRFIQYLEGPYDQILELYNRIKTDDRHRNVLLINLAKEALEERVFPSWAMGGKAISDEGVKFDTSLSEAEKEEFLRILEGKGGEADKLTNTLKKVFK